MRLEATVPVSRATALIALAEELGVSRSQLIDEALALLLKAVLEMKRGRRLVLVEVGSTQPVCELTTSTLTTLEWAYAEKLQMSAEELIAMKKLHEKPPPPSARLRNAAKRRKK